ncbi:putative enzyme related to lactoylglutathione lyase [Kitasatospora sp. MAP12-15]|uniref:VOC family protein n=1 Tax=unclassified Kitasatospora TaxID=2633591 RepID=UPI002476F98C|nr:VOC family protein [Kitasatospora sp. MAP12-44]MDH6114899.1 putative enzyme related to lactoylglutathione lyase [Kitasatospora sp. MAP12-44]
MTEAAVGRAAVRCVPAVPSWVTLMARDLDAAQAFYGPLLGWCFEPGPDRWGPYVRAVVDGVAVAGLSSSADLQLPVAWTTYFGTENADVTAERVRARGGTMAVGPLGFDAGRLAVAADPAGAPFGIWEGKEHGGSSWLSTPGAPVWIELRTRDAFEAALFYGEVFAWDARDPRQLEVRWEHDRVVLRTEGRSVAALARLADDTGVEDRPAWHVYFSVAATDSSVAQALALGASAITPATDTPYGRVAHLNDPQGGRFSLISSHR